MTEQETRHLLETAGAILNGHFVFTSGRHGDTYINKDAVYPHTRITASLCMGLGELFLLRGIEVVVGPALGGIILSQRVAEYLENHSFTHRAEEGLSVFAEKHPDGHFLIGRGQEMFIPDRHVLVVEDILTTGGSASRTVEAVRAHDGHVIAVAAIVNRGGVTAEDLDVPELKCLLELDLQSWSADECPLCQEGMPVNTEVGHGAEFVRRKGGG